MSNLETQLSSSVVEKDNENTWRTHLMNNISGAKINSPFGGDGELVAKNPNTKKDLKTLLEFKFDVPLKNKLTQCNILIQCLYYIKKYEKSGQKLPSTIFVGDSDECFAIHTNSIVKYLGHNVDWLIAPSDAHRRNPEMIRAMVDDVDILPFVFDVDENFKIQDVIDKLWDFTDNVVRKIRITKDNIVNIYDYYDENVLKENTLTTNEKANLFIQLVINPNENFIHPKKSVVVTKSYGELNINRNQFTSFFSHFEGDVYSPKEKENLTALVDRLVEEETRRKKGEFFTPTAFVDLAHDYISNTFGSDWKEKFVVWDNSCGTMNLTRDYKFNELYCSTLEQSDIDTANQMGYNPEATKFQYDFLNGDFDVLPEGLKSAIDSGKEILFLINPPYQDGSELSTNEGDSGLKNNVQTKTNKEMLENNWGRCSRQLYAQFLYRITKFQELNNNIKIGIFCPPLFLSGESYLEFRKHFLTEFKFESGFVFEASHFSDVAKGWGISFTLFNNGENDKDFILDVIECGDGFELIKTSKKEIYNTDKHVKLVTWLNEKQHGEIEKLLFKSTLKPTNKTILTPKNTIGTITWQSNNVSGSQQFVTMFSGAGVLSGKGSLFVTESNYFKSILFLTSRRLVSNEFANWINWNDEFIFPNEEHPKFEQFKYDSVVYSLFNTKSGFGGLRDVQNENKTYNVFNEFFWMSKETIKELGETNNYDELYRDARSGSERFVYNKLFVEGLYDKLSPDAKRVLDMASELVVKSIPMRQLMSDTNPEYHLNSWDCGYSQMKLVWKEYFKENFDQFRLEYKKLEDRMRPLVYELGFLK